LGLTDNLHCLAESVFGFSGGTLRRNRIGSSV
jgi:hypothetical protein